MMDTDILRDAMTKRLANQVAKEIDIPGMAKRLAPRVAAAVEKGILEGIGKVNWPEMLEDAFFSPGNWSHVQEFILVAMGIKPKKRGK